MLPYTSSTLYTSGFSQRTRTSMSGQAFTRMTHPRLTEITNGSLMIDNKGNKRERERHYTIPRMYNVFISFNILTTIPIPVTNVPGCLTMHSPPLAMHFVLPRIINV